jgi:hypothetical protein
LTETISGNQQNRAFVSGWHIKQRSTFQAGVGATEGENQWLEKNRKLH